MIDTIEMYLFSFISAILVQKIANKHDIKFIVVNSAIFATIVIIFKSLINNVREGIDNLPIVKEEQEEESKNEMKKEIIKEVVKEDIKEMEKENSDMVANDKIMIVEKTKKNIPIPQITEIIIKMTNGDMTVSHPTVNIDEKSNEESNEKSNEKFNRKNISQLSKGKITDFVLMDPKYWLDETPLRGICKTDNCNTQPIELGSVSKYLRVDK